MSAEELVDVLDGFGEKTGEALRKSEVHDRGLWHSGVHVWIYNSKGEVLLQRRSPEKDIYPDTWDISAAGHISAGEAPVTTALRETQEELGLKLEADDLRYLGTTRLEKDIPPRNWVHRVFDWTYLVRRDVDVNTLSLQKEEVTEVRWFALDEFEAMLKDPEQAKQFSPRPKYLYDLAIFEIRKALGEAS